MNAIILAAGKSSRMKKDGCKVNKPFLPIMGIANIERTILMLREFGIEDIIVICRNEHSRDYIYLKERYNCRIVIPHSNFNTLYSISCVVDNIDNTFIIEGDVVLARNIFIRSEHSFYYTMKYFECEPDAWCPIIENERITDFRIGKFTEPCIFGVSFWNHSDSKILKSKLISMFTKENFNNESLFWDDCVCSILDKIHIGVYEITQMQACEMNTRKEYIFAQKMCEQYYLNCDKFISDGSGSLKSPFQIEYVHDLETCSKWQSQLINHLSNTLDSYGSEQPLTHVFDKGEYPFMIRDKCTKSYLAYFDVAESSYYFLLRRLYIDEKYRRQGLGSEIVNFLKLYSKLSGKEMRVNVYDKNAEKFYISLGLDLYFKTYRA